MGEVWQGRDLRLGRAVAVKVMLQDAGLNPTARKRFQQEAMIAAGLRHDGITTVYDAAEHNGRDRHAGRLFIVSELLDGENLAEYLAARSGDISVSQAIGFGIQLADALAFAHDRGIVHRDLKPPNIFVQDRGGLKVCDFGIAGQVNAGSRFTQAGLRLGTPAYMAPEQWEGKPAAPSMDLYALGCLLYLMATGTQPFDGHGGLDHVYMQQHFHEPPVPPLDRNPQVPAALNGLILALLAKAPEARPADARAVLRALTRLRDAPGGPPPVAPAGPAPGAAPPQPAVGSAPTDARPHPAPAGPRPLSVLRRAALVACASPDLDNFEVLAAGQSGRVRARQDTADGEGLYGASGRWLPWFTASELPGPVTALAGSMSRPGGHWAVAAVAEGVPYLKLGPQEARPLLDARGASPVSLPVRDVAVSHAPERPQVFALDRVGRIWRLSWPDVKWALFGDSVGSASEPAAAIAAACSSAGYQAVAAVTGTRLLVKSTAPYGDWTGWRATDLGRRLLGTACSVGERHCAVFALDESGAIWRSAFQLDQPAPQSTALAWDAVSPPPGGVTGIAVTALEARSGAADGGALLVVVTADGAVHSARYKLGYGFQPQWSGWRQMPTLG
jgi:hypothetical protein